MFNWFKRKPEKVEVEKESTAPLLEDFPAKDYKIYWETFVIQKPSQWEAIVRFYGKKDYIFKEEKHLQAPTEEVLGTLVHKTVSNTMSKHKV